MEDLRHMGPTKPYKDNSPDGYHEHLEYADNDYKVNTPEDKITEWADIKAKAKELATESEHGHAAPKHNVTEPPKVEMPKTVFKNNDSGDVPTHVNPKKEETTFFELEYSDSQN